MSRLRWITAGESHGAGVLCVVEGLPAGLPIDLAAVDEELRRRQQGYGRGKRMQIEQDRARVLSGLKRGKTLGSPITILIENRDHRIDDYRRLTRPRPGHADLPGAFKYGTTDCGDVMERASARETAARVAAGALAMQFLAATSVHLHAAVTRIGEVPLPLFFGTLEERAARTRRSALFAEDEGATGVAVALIDACREAQDTVGGQFVVEAHGLPIGLGSPMQWDSRLDGRLAQAVMAIQGIKAVEIGAGVLGAELRGSQFHDHILPGGGRTTNRAGGLEGGMTNGQPVCVRATMKPIPSVRQALPSYDLETGEAVPAVYERSDVCSVPAASRVGLASVALVLADALLEKTGGDALPEVLVNLAGVRARTPRS